ncbi:methylamine utilization protein [Methanosarcina sp. 2.H.T.1A.6]|uniref:methylamine methyltransferase corrinoid protein reductive activase n=1 Tax=unclassified Methanosarcina TaxID=2644672 RepID=UPI000621F422|nr:MULTISPECIES: methylamine methyltransferase corrinoid protein reductive activase [unclassified Methanosarcina]KKG13670.1 methylamine utilization protein [Methanosarcina sp. 2.H.T.1A.3]KKG24860.1 methylamine utilization protein [Methanosarcina sp. 2.H.T.1A.6]KKG26022.1 methylamine utilization protein [Methanosarcina sp. 2.H.T.1A.8]KKG27832.1 methylamine utilization protein [Methanosarcina sp. 2.H.T.1A.15]
MYGIALDLGTSGFRAQLIDLETKKVVRTAMTMRHPLPGGNVIDHLDFALEVGEDIANNIVLDAVKKIIETLNADPASIKKLVVCGNPIQLSLFQNSEIRDLAFAGKNMQKRLGVENVDRSARIFPASEIFKGVLDLPNCEITVPPAIAHEIGADALAMMIETDFLNQKEVSIVTDYGTNAEMAIKVGDRIITGSAAAGPAIEGQGISCGMIASPGAISDVNSEGEYWRLTVLNEKMESKTGDLVNPVTGEILEKGEIEAVGITGTGVIAVIAVAMETGLMEQPPKLPNGKLILGKDIEITSEDISEAGKAIGAIHAAQLALILEAGVTFEELENVYMSGATGTYVDCKKARKIGSCPDFSRKAVQFGNTSMALAREILLDESRLKEVIALAGTIKADHLMMATSETFKNIYTCELSYWTEGMSMKLYKKFMRMYKYPPLPEPVENAVLEKRAAKDIEETGDVPIEIVEDVGITLEVPVEGCLYCKRCNEECPENALVTIEKNGSFFASCRTQDCLGTSCRRCVRACPIKAIDFKNIAALSVNGLQRDSMTGGVY